MDVEDGAAVASGKAAKKGDAMEEEDEEGQVETKVWRPGVDQLAEGEGASFVCVHIYLIVNDMYKIVNGPLTTTAPYLPQCNRAGV